MKPHFHFKYCVSVHKRHLIPIRASDVKPWHVMLNAKFVVRLVQNPLCSFRVRNQCGCPALKGNVRKFSGSNLARHLSQILQKLKAADTFYSYSLPVLYGPSVTEVFLILSVHFNHTH